MSEQAHDDFLAACKDFDQAMLITHSQRGQLTARPMYIAKLDADGDLWFATDVDSAKVDEIKANPEVCVTMSGGGTYVSISGRARVEHDKDKIEQMWNEGWRVWFPDGKTDPRLTLINVEAREGEYWSNSGLNRFKYLFQAAKAYATGQRPQIDEAAHRRVHL